MYSYPSCINAKLTSEILIKRDSKHASFFLACRRQHGERHYHTYLLGSIYGAPQDITKTGNGEWGMENGEWRMENGEWGMENGNGEWGMENGE